MSVNTRPQVSLSEAATLIGACGSNVTHLLEGQPGIGKSAILKTLTATRPDYLPCYVDVANLDLGDLGMPVIDRDAMTTNYAPNARFGLGRNQKRPVILMLDELGKASRPVMNMLLPVILEHRLGDVPLPTGSIVFATTNLATDGVGDNIPAHAYNRMSVVDVRNPNSEEWLAWAANNNVAPEVMAFAKEFPQVFERYDSVARTKGEKNSNPNPYIFNPMGGNTRAYCSPRSLERASHVIKVRSQLSVNALIADLSGTVGESAARDMQAMVDLSDKTPRFEAVIQSPSKCKLPSGAGAYFLMAFMLATRSENDTIGAILEYVDRWDSFEAKTLFIHTLAANQTKVTWAAKHKGFGVLAAAVGRLL